MGNLYIAPASRNSEINIPSKTKRRLKRNWTPHNDTLDVWTPYEDLKATVLSPVCATNVDLPSQYDAVPMWGVSPTAVEAHWKEIQSEGTDFIIFYSGSENYPYIGRVQEARVQTELAKTLWPYYEIAGKRQSRISGEPWNHIFYFDAVWYAEIPKDHIEALLNPRGPKDRVTRQFRHISKKRLPQSPQEVITHWIDEDVNKSVASAAVTPPKEALPRFQTYLKLIGEAGSDAELLSMALFADDIDPENLSESSKKKLVNCLYNKYNN